MVLPTTGPPLSELRSHSVRWSDGWLERFEAFFVGDRLPSPATAGALSFSQNEILGVIPTSLRVIALTGWRLRYLFRVSSFLPPVTNRPPILPPTPFDGPSYF